MSDSVHYSGGGEKTVAKTVILDKYLQSYLDIMSKEDNWSGPKWYVDSHAGTGFTAELGVEVPGSALRALQHDFDRFYFYEKDSDNFQTLIETINAETEANLSIGTVPDEDEAMGYCNDPYIRVFNMDCNDGVTFLSRYGRGNAHWFTFVDPERLSVERELMETLCRRGNMDILFNFQTTAFHWNSGEDMEHSHERVASNLGEDFPVNGTPDELVNHYKDAVFEELGWRSRSRKMVSEGSNQWRYDLVFASKKKVAVKIMGDIFNGDLKNDVAREIRDWREKSDADQAGLDTFLRIGSHNDDDDPDRDDDQSGLDEFC